MRLRHRGGRSRLADRAGDLRTETELHARTRAPGRGPFDRLRRGLARRSRIDARIKTVLDHGNYILGPEVAELEKLLATATAEYNPKLI